MGESPEGLPGKLGLLGADRLLGARVERQEGTRVSRPGRTGSMGQDGGGGVREPQCSVVRGLDAFGPLRATFAAPSGLGVTEGAPSVGWCGQLHFANLHPSLQRKPS